jgi:hypothetical protein
MQREKFSIASNTPLLSRREIGEKKLEVGKGRWWDTRVDRVRTADQRSLPSTEQKR